MEVRALLLSVALVLSLAGTSLGYAQPPSGATGECKDGTYTSATTERGACSDHGGVKRWYGTGNTPTGTQPQPPSGATGQCKDGTYTSATTERGACSKHGGVKQWYGTGNTTNPPSQSGTSGGSTTTSGNTPTGTQPAPGGGPGKVWVNTSTHVYHCANDQWYGKTKRGMYMSESDAIAKGNRPSHGQRCS